jgi:phosphoadenosine phosphosulfate reductase
MTTQTALRLAPPCDPVLRAAALAEQMAVMGLRDRLALIERTIEGRTIFTTGFGLEGQVLAHALSATGSSAEWTTIDTGRLFPETIDVWAATEARFGRTIRAVASGTAATEALVERDGAHGMRHSAVAREACCDVRKVEPLGRALEGAGGWITGLRAGQSEARGQTKLASWDAAKGLFKFAPLADWSKAQVKAYVEAFDLPYNALHDRGFPSIGCAPCTRAVNLGEDERAGRWWWEAGDKECGLHRRVAA